MTLLPTRAALWRTPASRFLRATAGLTPAAAYSTRVRFAPSPTGNLHLGGLRTALFNYLFARHTGGRFILRIEDTDQKRLVPGAVNRLVAALRWAGVTYDEGPDVGGDHGPYVQSARSELYQCYARELIERNRAYRCFCTPERLAQYRTVAARSGKPPVYDKRCTHLSQRAVEANLAQGLPYTVRLRFPDDLATVPDEVYGSVRVNPHVSDDAVLLKSDGLPTYHLANVVDDHLMGITHVLRGEEWLSSTAKHVALYRALGWPLPKFVHLPLLLNADGSKLSKRTGDTDVAQLSQAGYLPEAVVNYVAQLGWAPAEPQDLFTLDELVAQFTLTGINTSNPTVDYTRLDWLNRQHFRRLWASNPERRAEYLKAFQQQVTKDFPDRAFSADYIARAIDLCKDRITKTTDFGEATRVCFAEPQYDPAVSASIAPPNIQDRVVDEAIRLLSNLPDDLAAERPIALRDHLPAMAKHAGIKKPQAMKIMRFALTGLKTGPGVLDLADLYGSQECLRRLELYKANALPSTSVST
ncbi:Glutamate--tRNA ligase mitochondrial [Tieghemiomyces parasiticus]|uniref:Glutamate--tRNA ligase, mitochondrial n=1 Tax=Tieghemiomyces parasiticus TaxID=78921 RepID=A0A9W8AEB2_9FUNG|nr:Glutamate--tRNA ligase mitochondrial [Tieghemiomyces parasiticus]